MKKPTRSKLSLATEIVRALSATDLVQVHGGLDDEGRRKTQLANRCVDSIVKCVMTDNCVAA